MCSQKFHLHVRFIACLNFFAHVWVFMHAIACLSWIGLAYYRIVASLSLFYRYYFGRCWSKLAQLVPLLFSQGRSTCYSDTLNDFSVTIPRCYKNAYVNSFFPCLGRLWNSLLIKCFPLTYDLNGINSTIEAPINCRFFIKRLPLCFNLFVILFL